MPREGVSAGQFLCGIAALIHHPASQAYLLLRRAADRGGSWECVTGRVDQGESFEEAVRREVREELGVEVTLDFIIGTSRLYRGEPAPENELLTVQYACSILDRDGIRISAEHSEHRWLSTAEIADFLQSEHWLHPVIRRAEQTRTALDPALLALHRAEGFEGQGSYSRTNRVPTLRAGPGRETGFSQRRV